jgi:uncharacterized membrane protein
VGFMDQVFQRLPLVRIVYTSTKDLLSAFVGEKRRFNHPVIVATHEDGVEKALGFITTESLEQFGLKDHVTVYLPFSYAVTGAVRIYPRKNVRPIDVDTAELMAIIVSGGVTHVPEQEATATSGSLPSKPRRPASPSA